MFRALKNLIAGLSLGAILGVLFAPKKGSETRKNIKEKGFEGVKETAKEITDDLTDTATDIYEDISKDERFKKGMATAKKYGKEAKKKAGELYKENVPAKDRKKIKKAVKKTKSEIKKGYSKAKKKIDEMKD